jgi:endothelin-converting enzyme
MAEWIMSRFFVQRAFSEEAKALGDQIIHDIKDTFSTKLNQSEWMTGKSSHTGCYYCG